MFERLRYRLRLYSYRYMRFIQHFIANIRLISGALGIVTMVMAVFCLTTLIIFAGFDLQPAQALHLRQDTQMGGRHSSAHHPAPMDIPTARTSVDTNARHAALQQ